MLAEATAKAAEHVALLKFLQQQQQKQQMPDQKQQGAGVGQQVLTSALPWYKPLAEARAATGDYTDPQEWLHHAFKCVTLCTCQHSVASC